MSAEEKRFSANPVEFEVGSSRYQISPTPGFHLMRWSVSTFQGTRDIFHWPEEAQTFDGTIMGGNPILFPFAGRCFDRGVQGIWRSPDGIGLAMPIHGFARKCPFKVIEQTPRSISGELQPDKDAITAYPFDYRFTVQYQFEELSMQVEFSLTNLGGDPIPWSAGHHFFFNLPWHTGASRKDYLIRMDPKKCGYHGPDGKIAVEKDREKSHDLSDPALHNRIHWQLRGNQVAFGPKGGEEDLQIVIGKDPVPQKNYAIVTWSASESAPFYCIEPWMGLPNAAEHGKGLHWVNPGNTDTFTTEIRLF